MERGYRWVHRGETERALATFAYVLRQNPESALAQVGRGDACFEAKRDQDAISAYTQALALLARDPLDPATDGDAETVGRRFLSYQNQGLVFPFGVTAYLYLRRGAAHHALGVKATGTEQDEHYDRAEADYLRALELAPRYQAAADAQRRLWQDRMRTE